jgi:hypothetical protein
LRLDARRTTRRLTVELSRPALLTVRAHGRALDRWLAPAGRSLHPLTPPALGALRLTAVDGAGDHATRVLRPARHQDATGPAPPRRHSSRG